MKRLGETHGTTFELVRHFLPRMFDSEMFPAPGHWRSVAVGAFALALPAGMLLLDPAYAARYHALDKLGTPEPFRAAVLADELSLLTLIFSITGILALLEWQSLFPSRRDYLALAAMPVRPGLIFAARFAAVLIFSAAIVIAMNLLPSIIVPLQFSGRWQQNSSFLPNFWAQAASSGLGCVFVLFGIVALQGVLLNVLPAGLFARVSGYVQGALIAALLLAGLLSWSIGGWEQDTIASLPEFGAWAPPVWFAGLHETMAGSRDPFLAAMARRALLATAAAAGAALLMYFASYRRYRALLVEARFDRAAPSVRQWSLIRLIARSPRQEAVMDFMAKTLARNRLHRLVVLAYAGAAAGIALNSSLLAGAAFHWSRGWREAMQFACLFWPIATSVIVLSGFRHVFSMPAEPGANWIFQAAESQGRAEWMKAVERFVLVFVIAPMYLLMAPIAVEVLGWRLAARATVLEILVSLLIFEILFHSWQQLPFTCSYLPGKKPLIAVLIAYFGVLAAAAPIVAIIIAVSSQMTETFVVILGVFGTCWLWARKLRRDGWGEARLIYEDAPDAVADLGIKELTYGGTAAPVPESAMPHADPPGSTPPREYPRWLSCAVLRLRALVNRRRLDRDLEDELAFHLAMREERLREDGLAAAEARAAVRRRFGNITSVKETCREMWTFAWVETFWMDVRYGVRQLRRSPGLTTVASLTLALGIGITTAVYTLFDTVLWRPVPLPDAGRLAAVLQSMPDQPHLWAPAAPADIEDLRRKSTAFEDLASWSNAAANLVEAGGEPVRIEQCRVTPNFFDVAGVRPSLGRGFLPGEDEPGRDREAILSDGCWRRRFGADPGIVGREIRLNDETYTVIGVMPETFGFPTASREVWTPLALRPEERHSRSLPVVDSIGRLKPGVTQEQAAAELNAIAMRLERLYPDTNKNRRFVAWPVYRYMHGDYAPQMARMLFSAALFVLLIACVNVANLQFARAAGRWREVALRAALGAGRRRILRQLVTESIVLAMAGAAAGLVVAKWGLWALKAGIPAEMRRYMAGWNEIGLNGRALGFAIAAAVVSGIAAGLAPAWRSSRPNLTESLKEGGRGASPGAGRHRVRLVLVAGQVALSAVLLVGAGLMVRALDALVRRGAELQPSTLLTFRLALSWDKYRDNHQVAEFYREVLQRTAALPGVRSAAAATALPYSRHWSTTAFAIEGRQPEPGKPPAAAFQAVSADYFRTMHIPLRAGRPLAESDGAQAARVAVISERMARRWWPGEPPPLGRRIRIGADSSWVTIVGIAGDIAHSTMEREPAPMVYVPYLQHPERGMDIGLRTAGDPMRAAAAVTSVIRSIDREQPITNLNTLETLIRQDALGLAYMAGLMGVFGALALALSSIGVYGVTAYLVSQQRHEIGVRLALGAPHRTVLGMVFRRGMLGAGAGLAIGLPLAYGLARVMEAASFGLTAIDPGIFVGIPAMLAALAGLATYIPARRAMDVDPIEALRSE